jgi:hypothetical protein
MKKAYSKSSRQGLPGGPNEMFQKVKSIIVSQRGQWDFPGMNTLVPTQDGRITMRGVPYPVLGQDETGYTQMMYPEQEYQFPGQNVLELPMAQKGGEETSWTDYINPMNWGVTNRDEAGDFKKAFRAARANGDDEFMWYGKRYNTKLAPTSEEKKPKSNVLDLDNALDYLVETRGGTRDLWGRMADTIGYHESWHTMDPLKLQGNGGPGRGIFQFEPPSLITAQNRYRRIANRLNLKTDPEILNAKSAIELSPEQQYALFLINTAESEAKLKDYADNKLPLVDLWLQGHKKKEVAGNRESFRASVQKAKAESIQNGYDSFKRLGGALPKAQNGLTVSEIWEQKTGTPWSEAKNKKYTSGSFQDNIKLRQQLLSGTFNNNVTQSTNNKLQSQPLTNDVAVIDIKANNFNDAFKQARNTLGANKIFVWNGRKYGTNLKGEDFKPDEKTLAEAGLNDKQTKVRLEKENKAIQDPYIGKSTVKLEGDWKDLEEVKTDKKQYEKSSQAERIVRYKNEIKDGKNYVIVDKEKGLLHIYKPGESKPIFTSGIDLGKNIGDDQTVTKALDTNKDDIITEADKVKNRWVVDWEKGSGTTGAGRYYVSNITKNSIEPGYEGYPSINMMNERQHDEFKKSGKIENISTSFHKGYVVDDNNRVSNGCIRCNKTTLNNLVQQLSNSSEVYILPEDRDEQGNLINEFVYENGKLNFRTKDYNKYLTYKDSKGQTQKGQGLNRTEQTLNYKPITLGYDPVRLSVLSKGAHDEVAVESFSDALSDNKQKIMKVAQINGDTYNEIAKMAFGILGAETNWGETFNIGENVVKGIGRMITGKVGGPDYSFKADVGRTNPDDSVGLTQLKWKWVSEGERKKLKELGITSSEDFLDPQKAAIGTALILGIRYNEQLKSDQKANIWENLPSKWNNKSNYARRIKFNSAPVFVSEYTGDPKKGDVIKQNYKKETTKKIIENTIKQDSSKPFISESTGLNPLTRNINYEQINFPKQQLGGALPRFQYAGQFNPQLARPNPLTGRYAWEQSIPKKTAVNVAPKIQPAARATTNVQKQNLNLDRDNRLLDANLIYSDASSNPLSNAVHTGLDAVGMVPVIGEPADLANALLYNYEGDLENAATSTAGMIPFLGMLGTGKRLAGKAAKGFKSEIDWAKNTQDIVDDINNRLSHGLGVKKQNVPLSVKSHKDEEGFLHLHTYIGDKLTGIISLRKQTPRPKTFSESIFGRKTSTPIEKFDNTKGYSKYMDYPFRNIPAKSDDIIDKFGARVSKEYYNAGISGEFNKAINETLSSKGLGTVLSDRSGIMSEIGKKRWDKLVEKGLAEHFGEKLYKMKPSIYKALAPIMGLGAAGTYGVNQLMNQEPESYQVGGDTYNMQRALELGYTPDETGHWKSVDDTNGMWLKSKQHPTAWMEYMQGYALNPENNRRFDVVPNVEGYFGDNQLQYVDKSEVYQIGGSLQTDPVLNFITQQQPRRFSKSKK